jgi:hypothetical protein
MGYVKILAIELNEHIFPVTDLKTHWDLETGEAIVEFKVTTMVDRENYIFCATDDLTIRITQWIDDDVYSLSFFWHMAMKSRDNLLYYEQEEDKIDGYVKYTYKGNQYYDVANFARK